MKATHVNFFTVTYLQLGPFGENSLFVIALEKERKCRVLYLLLSLLSS